MTGASPSPADSGRPLRIGFFGNVNNYPMNVARAFRRAGHDVHVCIDTTDPLDRPECRYEDIALPYPPWIHDVGSIRHLEAVIPTPRRNAALRILRGCDALVLNSTGPALWPSVRRPAVIIATGSDLEWYTNPATIDNIASIVEPFPRALRSAGRRFLYQRLIHRQRAGYRAALAVNFHAPGISPKADRLLDGLGISGDRRLSYMFIPLDVLRSEPPRMRVIPRIFAVARHVWVKPLRAGMSQLDDKGNDVMIHGLARYVRETGAVLDIRFVEKGQDVAASKELVDKVGLAHLVTWQPVMTQSRVWDEYRAADIIFDNMGSSTMSMGALEAMAVGRPVIANGRPDVTHPILSERSPHCQARTAEEVADHLKALVPDLAYRAVLGEAARTYIERNHDVDKASAHMLSFLTAAIRT